MSEYRQNVCRLPWGSYVYKSQYEHRIVALGIERENRNRRVTQLYMAVLALVLFVAYLVVK